MTGISSLRILISTRLLFPMMSTTIVIIGLTSITVWKTTQLELKGHSLSLQIRLRKFILAPTSTLLECILKDARLKLLKVYYKFSRVLNNLVELIFLTSGVVQDLSSSHPSKLVHTQSSSHPHGPHKMLEITQLGYMQKSRWQLRTHKGKQTRSEQSTHDS